MFIKDQIPSDFSEYSFEWRMAAYIAGWYSFDFSGTIDLWMFGA